MSLANNIKKLREDKELRQKEVANAIDLGYTAYNKVENGVRDITVNELQRLAVILKIIRLFLDLWSPWCKVRILSSI